MLHRNITGMAIQSADNPASDRVFLCRYRAFGWGEFLPSHMDIRRTVL